MKTQDFDFDLPASQIAQYPLASRSASRLLCYDKTTGISAHATIGKLPTLLKAGDLLVLNDTKVLPARFFGHKETGGKVEFLLERILDETQFLTHIRASKAPKAGSVIILAAEYKVRVLEKCCDLYRVEANAKVQEMIEKIGHIPLPPYISREDVALDKDRYQTVYAKHQGSVAAPTAGLHFDQPLLEELKKHGIAVGFTTLHVGAGTFKPVTAEYVSDHKMHKERFLIDAMLAEKVNATKEAGRRVIAVGTTALRALESAQQGGRLYACKRETDIFLYPGHSFGICDGLITNFHLPKSTLLMLVAAFIGYKATMDLYKKAIEAGYRFFSYGDACLLL